MSLQPEWRDGCLPVVVFQPEDVPQVQVRELGSYNSALRIFRIPDDCIDSKRYPLFMARAVLKELIESLQSTQGVKPC